MKVLTPEKRAELRRDYGPDLKVIELEDYEDLALVMRAPTLKAWGAAFDGLAKPALRGDALHNLLLDCTVWPSVNEVVNLLDVVPALPENVWPLLASMAGAPEERLELVEVGKLSGEDRATLLSSGLPETRLHELMAAYPRRGQLAALRIPGALWLLKKSRQSYNTFRRLSADGKVFDGLYKMALACVVWPGEEAVAAMAERAPGLISAVGEALLEMVGDGARIRVGGI